MSNDLTEEALEKALQQMLEFTESRDGRLVVRPTQLYIRPEVITELAREHGVTEEEIFAAIKQLVAEL